MPQDCSRCGGKGEVELRIEGNGETRYMKECCSACGGKGF